MTWEEIYADPALKDLPHKIEQDRFGRIIMTPPPAFNHSGYAAAIVVQLTRLLPGWRAYTECPVLTAEGVRVPDIAVLPLEIARSFRDRLYLPRVPGICIEVLSPRNSAAEIEEKRRLYAGAGCLEFWICDEAGKVSFQSASGETLSESSLCPSFPTAVEL